MKIEFIRFAWPIARCFFGGVSRNSSRQNDKTARLRRLRFSPPHPLVWAGAPSFGDIFRSFMLLVGHIVLA